MMLASGILMAGPDRPASSDVWEQLDIIPMPKEIFLTGKTLALDDPAKAVLVIGEKPLRQSVIGAEWINARIVEQGGRPLPVTQPTTMPAGVTAMVIGTVDDNPLIARAAAEKFLNIGAQNPGVRGYEIKIAADGKTVYLGGADALGALYACVTFGELLRKQAAGVAWREAVVRDWPDCINIVSGYSVLGFDDPESKDIKAYYDRLLRWKITGLSYRRNVLHGEKFKPTPGLANLKAGIEYGKERGIGALLYAEKPYVGLAKYHPEAARDKDKVMTAAVTAREAQWIRGWEFDDIRRETARDLAEYVRAAGFTDVAFHDTDTGGWDNPAQWNFRPEASKKRWGDDYAAATAHIHKIYYEELKKLNPELRLHFVFYPYTIWIFDDAAGLKALDKTIGGQATAAVLKQYQERYTDFWKKLHAGFPTNDVNFAIRETTPVAVQNWRKLIPGRGAFTWEALMTKYWTPIFSEAAAWTPTFCTNLNDFLCVTYAGNITPLQVLAVREYSWNKQTPGAKPWALLDSDEHWRHAEPQGEIYSVVLPKLARNVFGHQAAPYIVRALSCNIEPDQALGRVRSSGFNLLKTPERMAWAAENAARAAAALNELWAQCAQTQSQMGMDDYAFRRFVVLRECLNACQWMCTVRTKALQAEKLAGENKMDEARQAIAAGLVDAENGRLAMRQLIAERPALVNPKDFSQPPMAHKVDFDGVTAELKKMLPALEKYAANAQVFNAIFDQLDKGRLVKGLQINAGQAPALDGRMDDPVWQETWPIECFTVIGHGRKMAQAFTRARLLNDGDALYVGFECRVPAGLKVQDKDTLDVFFTNLEGMGSDYAQLSLSAGSLFVQNYHQKTKQDKAWTTPQVGDAWPIEYHISRGTNGWSAEIKVPLRPMLHPGKTFGAWRVNLSRNCYFENAATEISAILPLDAANKHDVPLYPTVQFTATPAPPLAVTLNVADLKFETITLPDRIATVASFSVGIEANLALNDVVLSAETYGPDGKRQRAAKLAAFDGIYYQEQPRKTYEAEFSEVVPQGGILLKLQCAEGQAQRWLRFGGWTGPVSQTGPAGRTGSIYAAGPDGNQALHDACFFPAAVELDGQQIPLFDAQQGAIEMFISPMQIKQRMPGQKWVIAGEALFCFGPYKRVDNPIVVKGLPLGIVLYNREILTFVVTERGLAAGTVTVRLPEALLPDQWHHLACVWDAAAPRPDQMRVYFDGRRLASGKTDDDPDGKAVRVDAALPRSIQVGALKSGYFASDLRIAGLRISRVARYNDDFTAEAKLALDQNTSALFDFNGSLEGVGLAADGRQYSVKATAGIDY